jgi:hypothetical protein
MGEALDQVHSVRGRVLQGWPHPLFQNNLIWIFGEPSAQIFVYTSYFLLRFDSWVFWSINSSMAKIIKKCLVDQLWYILYPIINLMLFISHSHIQGFNTYMWGANFVSSV